MSTDNPTPAPNGVPAPELAGANGAVQAPATEKKLSNAELKKQKQAEKQAKRAQKKQTEGAPEHPKPQQSSSKPQQTQKKPSTPKATPEKQPSSPSKAQSQPQQGSKPRRPSGAQQTLPAPPQKRVGLFGHLYGQPRRHNLQGAGKDIHPAILALGLQMSNYEICGSNARCVAMLLAFKCVRRSRYTSTKVEANILRLSNHTQLPSVPL